MATQALYFLKKMTRNGHFPRPRETDPYEGDKEKREQEAKRNFIVSHSSSCDVQFDATLKKSDIEKSFLSPTNITEIFGRG